MGIFRWPFPARDIALPDLVDQLARFFKQSDAILVGGDRAHAAIDSSHTLQTAVGGNATIAGKPAGGVAAVFATEWMETFEAAPADWTVVLGARNYAVVGTGQTGGSALRQTGTLTLAFPWKVPYDASKLYRLRARVKRVSGAGQFTYGLRCLDVVGNVIATVAACVAGATPMLGSYGAEYTGWVKGYGAFVAPSTDASAPSPLPAGTVALQPYVTLNSGDGTGVMDLDYLDYDRMDEEASQRTYTSLISATDPRHASGARVAINGIDTIAMQALAVTEPKVADGAIIARCIVAGEVKAYHISVVNLAAINAVLGVVTTGLIRDPTNTYFLNLLNDGNTVFNVPGLVVTPTVATFSGTVASTLFTGTTAVFTGGVQADNGFNTDADYQVQGNGFGGAAFAVRLQYLGFGVAALTTGANHGIMLNTSKIGFYGATPVTKPALTYSRTGESTPEAQLRSVLSALGLVTDSTVP